MRVFVALDIDDAIRARLEQFLDGVRGFAPEARWVLPESMHVTLKFIGEKSSGGGGRNQAGPERHPGWQLRDFISRLWIFSNCEGAACFLDWDCGRPAAGRFGKVGG